MVYQFVYHTLSSPAVFVDVISAHISSQYWFDAWTTSPELIISLLSVTTTYVHESGTIHNFGFSLDNK